MMEYSNSRPARIVGPNHAILTRDMLPPASTTRWVAQRKAEVVAAVESGMMTVEEVMARYALSLEEFCSWQRAMEHAGVAGLTICWAQKNRGSHRRGEARPAPGKPELVH